MAEARVLAAELVETVRALHAARVERDAYRLLAREAVHALHDVSADREWLRRRNHELIDALRAERQRTAA